jgi:hypothetical protein
MRLSSWLRSARSLFVPKGAVNGRRPTQLRKRSLAAPLSVERLEDRTVLSTFTVLNLADSGTGSLRAAIADANVHSGADVIRFAGGLQGTIALGSELRITDDLTINGRGENHLTISGNNATRVFSISGSTTDVEFTRLTIADGSATGTTMMGPLGPVTLGGGILNNGGHLIVSDVTLADNQVVGFNAAGGAIANVFGATLTVDHSTFTGNESVGTREAAGAPTTPARP